MWFHSTRRHFNKAFLSFAAMFFLARISREDGGRQINAREIQQRNMKINRTSSAEFYIINGWVVHEDQFQMLS